MLTDVVIYSLIGYLSGSILYSLLYVKLFRTSDIRINSRDHNPGVANAFKNGGFACGSFALVGDFFKAFIPVYLYIHLTSHSLYSIGAALVMVAPVIGHIFPLFYGFKGGKGITSSFGSLAAVFPIWQPVAFLAILFLFFSCVLVIKPNYYKTLVTYAIFLPCILTLHINIAVGTGAMLIALSVIGKLLTSKEQKEEFKMEPIWKR
ncbi:glycerol-3-phosphate acyltransferase [Dubosiella newyorkensis]|uniref:glycerol-3-phosphate acyltransferase n=1 Tax=Dubosiella newyorkensis TaxID=1862672 RepID=UPI002573D6D5|nr:glycerol-3-phosphate acyltransferase [Dubosiella newyorkensis]